MGAVTRLFWILTGFFLLSCVGYTAWVWIYDYQNLATDPTGASSDSVEWVGSVGLLLVGLLSALIAFYVGRVYRGQGGELPEDRLDAEIDDGEAEQGFFSPWSWWPFMLAISAGLVFLGIAIGIWLAYIGAALAVISLIGWIFEYHRGYFGH